MGVLVRLRWALWQAGRQGEAEDVPMALALIRQGRPVRTAPWL